MILFRNFHLWYSYLVWLHQMNLIRKSFLQRLVSISSYLLRYYFLEVNFFLISKRLYIDLRLLLLLLIAIKLVKVFFVIWEARSLIWDWLTTLLLYTLIYLFLLKLLSSAYLISWLRYLRYFDLKEILIILSLFNMMINLCFLIV
jgi:hypothetical protein